jgi:ABC-type cobalamin/Fe3+-siderophores transport system ATPase subunit
MMPESDTIADLWKYRPCAYVRRLIKIGRKNHQEMLEALMDGMDDDEIRAALTEVNLDPEAVASVEGQQ